MTRPRVRRETVYFRVPVSLRYENKLIRDYLIRSIRNMLGGEVLMLAHDGHAKAKTAKLEGRD